MLGQRARLMDLVAVDVVAVLREEPDFTQISNKLLLGLWNQRRCRSGSLNVCRWELL